MTKVFRGTYTVMITPFDADGALDVPALEAFTDWQVREGIHGLIPLGSTGEFLSMTEAERETVARCVIDTVAGRVPVLIGAGAEWTDDAVRAARMAERAGADGVMIIPPYYSSPTEDELYHHYATIGAAIDLPIMIYNNRVAYKVDLSPADFATLADVENIVAVKESSHYSRRITDMINVLGDRYVIFCGVDDLVLENALFGAKGWVSGLVNSFPKEAVRLFRLARAGKVDEAYALYKWFMPLLHLDVDVKLVQMIKLANQMTGQGSENVRAPRLKLSGAERAMVEQVVGHALETRPDI